MSYASGSSIVKAGGVLQQLHILHSGEVSVQGGKGPATLKAGDHFGVESLFRHESAAASLVAVGQVVCMAVARDTVQRQLGPLSAILEREADKKARKATAKAIDFRALQLRGILGVGTFGTVRLVVDATARGAGREQTPYALKCMRKAKVYDMGQVEHIINECKLLAECEHPFVVRLVRTFEDAHSLYLLMDLTLGGELFSVLRAEKCFPERRCCFYAAMIVCVFDYLHDKAIVYRDLKPENLLIDAEGYLKVVDFGFAKRVEERTWTVCGTPEYMAPEIILNKGHDKAVDWWTLGILIFEMFVGYPPFEGSDAMDLYKKIVQNDVKYPKKVGPQALDLIRKLLHPSQTERLGSMKNGADDVKKHPFFRKLAWQSLLAKKIEAPFKPTIKSALDTSNFEHFDDPDEGVAQTAAKRPKGLFDEFTKLCAAF